MVPDLPDPTGLFTAMHAWRAMHPQATFADMEREAARQVASLRRDLVAAVLEPETDPPTTCPTCAGPLVRNGTTTRSVTTDHGEVVTVSSQRWRCSACGTELPPPQ